MNVLKGLPSDSSITKVLSILARAKSADSCTASQILQEVRLEEISSKLLEDADRSFLNGDTPSRHEEASSEYQATVYEVRDHTGAGWRGAVILDKDSNPWLVFADRHDQFHAKVANALKRPEKYEPNALDYAIRDYEDNRLRDLTYKRDLVSGLLEALREANSTATLIEAFTPEDAQADLGKPVRYTVEITHDEPADTVEEANLTISTVTISMAMSLNSHQGSQQLIACGVLYIQPDNNYHEYVYTENNELRLDLCITHAKLAQLLGETKVEETSFPPKPLPPTQLHWVPAPEHIEGVITGKAVQSLCGSWFVPAENERAELPVCGRCESILPLAQEMLDQLRLKAQN